MEQISFFVRRKYFISTAARLIAFQSFSLFNYFFTYDIFFSFIAFESRAQFHQRSMYSFYACRSQKRKKILMTWLSLYAFGLRACQSCTYNVDEIEPIIL